MAKTVKTTKSVKMENFANSPVPCIGFSLIIRDIEWLNKESFRKFDAEKESKQKCKLSLTIYETNK